MKAERILFTHFEKIYFALDTEMGDNIPNVCANIESPPNESIAVIQVNCICADADD